MGRWRGGHRGRHKDKDARKAASSKDGDLGTGSGGGDGDEAVWASRVNFNRDLGQLKIGMSRLAMTDECMGRWCAWFRRYLSSIEGAVELWAGDVDFAENRLTASGIGSLLETFSAHRVPVLVLKLHHNRIAEGGSLATFLRTCSLLQELHLSHNELDAKASAEIIAASASAMDSGGTHSYPRNAGVRGAAPLWVRLEQNHVDHNEFNEIMDTTYSHLKRPGSDRVFCDASSKWCTPHSCFSAQQSQSTPAVHLKNLQQQRRRAADGSQRSSSSGVPAPDSHGASVSGDSKDDGTELAKVLRWDWGVLAWVPDVIEVPPKESLLKKRSHESRSEHQENLSLGLKALIGIGVGPKTESREHAAAVADTPKVGVPQSQKLSRTPTSGDVRQSIGANILRALRGDVEPQRTGFTLNPQAQEFKPSLPSLNPEAPEFIMPQGLSLAEEPWALTTDSAGAGSTDDTDFSEAPDWFPRHPEASARRETEATLGETPKPLEPGLQNWGEVKRVLERREVEKAEEVQERGQESESSDQRESEKETQEFKEPLEALMQQLRGSKRPPDEEAAKRDSLVATAEDLKQCTTT